MLVRWEVIAMVMCAMGCPLRGHSVPTLVVEAEFNAARLSEIRVNIDPRLFLAENPTAILPIAASWWLEQDEAAKTTTVADAVVYLEKTLDFRIGNDALRGDWTVTAIDSATAFPLSAESAEVHLLAQRKRPLPDVSGEFKVSVSNDCPVGVILLNSIEGKQERHPQSLFPGENSRGFKVPELKAAEAVKMTEPSIEASREQAEVRLVSPMQLTLLLALTAGLLRLLWARRRG